jgi:hypothetical protein
MKVVFVNVICIAIGISMGLFIKYEGITLFPPNSDTVVEKIQKAAKLITIEHFVSDIIELHEEEPLFIPDQKAIVIAKGKVSAGFDLSKKISVSVSQPNHVITVYISKPQILSVDTTYKYYDIKGRLSLDNQNLLLKKAKETITMAALRAGILDQATESLKNQLGLYFDGYSVDIHTGETEKQTDPKKIQNNQH